ncbi:MAG: hypothetical protein U0996_15400 [Planctomycetaceae bacterium]
MSEKPVPAVNCPESCRVENQIPMVHVHDVDRSVAFYSLLGYSCQSRFSNDSGRTNWAMLVSGAARLMLAVASAPVVPEDQAVLFYMYSQDVRQLRNHLLQNGLEDAGEPPGEDNADKFAGAVRRSVVFDIVRRFYMPQGELRIHDPDGYCILVGDTGVHHS